METSDPQTTPATRNPVVQRIVGFAAAIAVAAGGVLHLCVWNADYRSIPDGVVPGLWVVKVGFPLNAAISVVLAAAVAAVALEILTSGRLFVLGAALAVQVGSIAALVLSRGPGIFGWTENGYDTSATQILVVEVLAAALLIGSIVLERTRRA